MQIILLKSNKIIDLIPDGDREWFYCSKDFKYWFDVNKKILKLRFLKTSIFLKINPKISDYRKLSGRKQSVHTP